MNLIQLAEKFYTAESISTAGSGLIFFHDEILLST
jgi:hypothetical protein